MNSAAASPTAPVRVYLSGVTSVTHLVYAASYVRFLLATCSGPVTLVDLGTVAFLGRHHVSAGEVRDRVPQHERLTVLRPSGGGRWQSLPGERLVYIAIGTPGIKPYLRLRGANARRSMTVVVVDEGLGSYGNWRTRQAAWRREGGGPAWSTLRALAHAAARRLLTDEWWALYRHDAAGWRVDERVAGEFRRMVAARPSVGDASAVFLSQPWVELGQVPEERYLAHLREIARQCAAAGLSFRLRPHPAEDPARYVGFELADVIGPAEEDPRVVSAGVVLGTTSTALLNLAAVHGTAALRVTLPELDGLEGRLSRAQRALLDTFLPAPMRLEDLAGGLPRQ